MDYFGGGQYGQVRPNFGQVSSYATGEEEPVYYQFITQLVIPVTDEWTCANFYGAQMNTILWFSETTISRGLPWIFVDSGAQELIIKSNDSVISSFRFALPFQQQFTFQVEFTPVSLPHDLTQLDKSRLFIGAYDKQDNAAGLLISKMGIAIVATYGNSVLPIPGSQGIFEEGVTYVMRMVVDGLTDKLDLYITKASEIETTGQQLRYTAPAPISPLDALDSIFINTVGDDTFPVETRFSALRANCTQCLTPNRRPIADPGLDQTLNLGGVVRYDGSESYDPEGATLTYRWALIDAPDTSRFATIGSAGYGYDDGGPDNWTTIFFAGSGAFSVDNAPNLQPGDHLIYGGETYEISTVGWILPSGSTWYERDVGGTWPIDSDRIFVTEDTIPKNGEPAFWKVCHTVSYFNDRYYVMPTAVPDVPGLYQVRLIVNDGHLDSLPMDELLNVSAVRLVLGCIPDLSWIWQYLSDFWRLVDGRGAVDTIWSGLAQAAAAQLMAVWQIDYNKSLAHIQRKFQRRWLNYDTVLNEDDPTLATINIVRGTISTINLVTVETALSALNNKVLQVVLDASAVQEIQFSGLVDGVSTLQDVADQINAALGLELSTTKIAQVVTVGVARYIVFDYATLLLIRPNTASNSANNILFGLGGVTTYLQNDLAGLGYIPYVGDNPANPPALNGWLSTSPTTLDFTTLGITAASLLAVDDVGYRIQKVATTAKLTLQDSFPEGSTANGTPRAWVIPSTVESASIDFDEQLVVAGDIARFAVREISTGHNTEVLCGIVAVHGARLGFNPRPLLEKFAGVPGNFEVYFSGIKHVSYIPVHEYVMDIPRLQEIIKDPPAVLTQNLEYFIDDTLGSNAIRFKDGLFSLADPPPDILWAEVTYLDNRPTIESNFGRLVNFKVEDLQTRTDNLDYLSAVQGLWWAYFGGPSLYRVRVGTQILLGLPFAEVDGTITEIAERFSATEGRILIQDKDDQTVTRSYFYPLTAGLGVLPATGETLKVGDFVEAFTPLSGGIEVKDWVSARQWYINYTSTGSMFELEKFFRWLVRVDVDTFSLVNISFAVEFIRKIKPHYTNPLLVLLKVLDPTEVDVEDNTHRRVVLNCWEHFDPLQCGAWRYDDVYGGGTLRHHWDATLYADKFLYDRHRLSPVISCWSVMYLHMDGYHFWAWDTIWAYDDGGGVDRIPLSGPTDSIPPPYGALWGTIHHDEKPPAGIYTRSKNL